MRKKISVGDVDVEIADREPGRGDSFLCSTCLAVVPFLEVHVVPAFDAERGWSGAYRCQRDRVAAYESARAALAACDDEHRADFFATIERWGPPLVALRPFTDGKPLRDAARVVLALLEDEILRLSPGPRPDDGAEPVWLAVDIVLAMLVAPRGHAVDVQILPMLRERTHRAIIVPAALHYAMCALRPGDRVDTDRWAELLALSEIDKATGDTPLTEPSADEIEHWRDVVFGAD